MKRIESRNPPDDALMTAADLTVDDLIVFAFTALIVVLIIGSISWASHVLLKGI